MINGLKKFAKGMFAIFTIKLMFLGVILIIQSCETNDEIFENSEKELALSKFENILWQTTPILRTGLKNNNSDIRFSRTENGNVADELDNEADELIEPLINGTKELLLAFEIEEKDLEEIFGSKDDPRLVIFGLALLSAENEYNNQTVADFSNLFIQSTYAQSGVGNCVLEALGVNAAVDALKGGIKKLGKKGAFKLLKKIAGKTLGPIGVVLAVVDFADCMGAFNKENFK